MSHAADCDAWTASSFECAFGAAPTIRPGRSLGCEPGSDRILCELPSSLGPLDLADAPALHVELAVAGDRSRDPGRSLARWSLLAVDLVAVPSGAPFELSVSGRQFPMQGSTAVVSCLLLHGGEEVASARAVSEGTTSLSCGFPSIDQDGGYELLVEIEGRTWGGSSLSVEVWPRCHWTAGPWQPCTAACDGGLQTRDVACVASSSHTRVGPACCAWSGSSPLSSRGCNQGKCTGHFWQAEEFGRCDQNCGGGTRRREVACVAASTNGAVADELCDASTRPSTTTGCSALSCSGPEYWAAGPWGECRRSEGDAERCSMARDVSCLRSDGSPGANCDATLAPGAVELCPCPSPQGHDADPCAEERCSGHGTCVAAGDAARCQCEGDFRGRFCVDADDCEGLPSADGECCEGAVDARGACCRTALDANGHCCPSGQVDACGVCDGGARAVDARGSCCAGVLDHGRICCEGQLDACGVCGGDGSTCRVETAFSAGAPHWLNPHTVHRGSGEACVGSLALAAVPRPRIPPPSCPPPPSYELLLGNISASVSSAIGVAQRRVSVADVALEGEPDASQARRLADGGAGALRLSVVAQVAQPPSLAAPVVSADEVADRLRPATVEAGERGAFLEDIAVSTSASVGICGNGVCESADCDSDCPLKGHFVCRGDDASTGAHCAGHGRCMRGNIQGEGICDCFAGWAAPACDACALGWTRVGGVCARRIDGDECLDADCPSGTTCVAEFAGYRCATAEETEAPAAVAGDPVPAFGIVAVAAIAFVCCLFCCCVCLVRRRSHHCCPRRRGRVSGKVADNSAIAIVAVEKGGSAATPSAPTAQEGDSACPAPAHEQCHQDPEADAAVTHDHPPSRDLDQARGQDEEETRPPT